MVGGRGGVNVKRGRKRYPVGELQKLNLKKVREL